MCLAFVDGISCILLPGVLRMLKNVIMLNGPVQSNEVPLYARDHVHNDAVLVGTYTESTQG